MFNKNYYTKKEINIFDKLPKKKNIIFVIIIMVILFFFCNKDAAVMEEKFITVDFNRISKILIFEEGYKKSIYRDASGIPHYGVGHCLKSSPVTLDVLEVLLKGEVDNAINLQLKIDIQNALENAKKIIPGWYSHSVIRRESLVMLVFQLGRKGLRDFDNALEYLEDYKYKLAAEELSDSKWAKKNSPARARAMIFIIENGYYPKRYSKILTLKEALPN
jgi:GH24 family phage-related lysozyme (muramidase)